MDLNAPAQFISVPAQLINAPAQLINAPAQVNTAPAQPPATVLLCIRPCFLHTPAYTHVGVLRVPYNTVLHVVFAQLVFVNPRGPRECFL